MPKSLDFYLLRIVNQGGVVYYLTQLSAESNARLKDRLDQHVQAGDLAEYDLLPVNPGSALTYKAVSGSLDDLLGSFEKKGRPDASKVEERLPEDLEQVVRDLLVSAFEGGSGYWARIESYIYPPGTRAEDFKKGGRMQPGGGQGGEYFHRVELVPTYPGGAVVIREVADGEVGGSYVIDLATLKRALITMREQFPRHYKNAMDGNGDAETGDLFLQLAAFGKLVYG